MDSDKHEAKNNSNMKMAVKTDSVKTGRLCSEYESKLVSTPVIDNDFSNAESFTKEPGFSRLKGFSLLSTDRRKNRALLINEETEIRRAINDGVPVNTLARLSKVHRGVINNIENKKGSMLSTATNQESKSNNSNTVSSDSNAGSSNVYKTSRKKHNVLSLADKFEVLQRAENGESPASLACVYNVREDTLRGWIKHKNKITEFASECKCKHILKKRKYIQKSIISTEHYLCQWYSQNLIQGKGVTLQDLRKKALEFNKIFCGPSNFKASDGWLAEFRSRYRIKQFHNQSKSFTGDTSAANPIQTHLHLLPEGFSRDDTYTTDETEIDWQTMPKNSVTYNNDKCNETAARVTVMVCANASGSHSLPLLVIGKTEKKICLKKFVCPVIYKWQRNGSMDSEIFNEWYTNEFIPAVKTVRGQTGKFGKVLLLLHNSPFHADIDKLNEVDESFKVRYLPSNVTQINQILIQKLKLIFEKNVLQLFPPENGELTGSSQNFSLEKCYMLSIAWNILCQENKKKPCKEQIRITEGLCASTPKSEIMEEFLELFQRIRGFSQFSKENASESLLMDTIDPGHQVHNESETIASLKYQELSEAYNTDNVDTSDERRPTNSEASVSLEILSEWLEEQKEFY